MPWERREKEKKPRGQTQGSLYLVKLHKSTVFVLSQDLFLKALISFTLSIATTSFFLN